MARSKNIPLLGPMLQAKAITVAAVMELGHFKASNGWLEEFKTRYNIKGMTVSGESAEVRRETVESWKERLPQILAGYRPKNILNMDETCKFSRVTKQICLRQQSSAEVANSLRRDLHVHSM